MSTYPQLIQGSTAWLYDVVGEQIAQINAELADAVKGGVPPHFAMFMGVPLTPTSPTVAVTYASTARTQVAQHNYRFDLRFRVMVLLPHSGDDSAAAFEMARQVAADNLQALFSDEDRTLTPSVNAGPLGTLNVLSTAFSGINDLFPRKLADGKTVIRGFELPFTMSFVLTSTL